MQINPNTNPAIFFSQPENANCHQMTVSAIPGIVPFNLINDSREDRVNESSGVISCEKCLENYEIFQEDEFTVIQINIPHLIFSHVELENNSILITCKIGIEDISRSYAHTSKVSNYKIPLPHPVDKSIECEKIYKNNRALA